MISHLSSCSSFFCARAQRWLAIFIWTSFKGIKLWLAAIFPKFNSHAFIVELSTDLDPSKIFQSKSTNLLNARDPRACLNWTRPRHLGLLDWLGSLIWAFIGLRLFGTRAFISIRPLSHSKLKLDSIEALRVRQNCPHNYSEFCKEAQGNNIIWKGGDPKHTIFVVWIISQRYY